MTQENSGIQFTPETSKLLVHRAHSHPHLLTSADREPGGRTLQTIPGHTPLIAPIEPALTFVLLRPSQY